MQNVWHLGPRSILFCRPDFLIDPALAHLYALHWYAIFQVHNKMRNDQSKFSLSIYRAVLKQLAIQHEFSRKVILFHQGRGDNPLVPRWLAWFVFVHCDDCGIWLWWFALPVYVYIECLIWLLSSMQLMISYYMCSGVWDKNKVSWSW